jgi:hypothetical protein
MESDTCLKCGHVLLGRDDDICPMCRTKIWRVRKFEWTRPRVALLLMLWLAPALVLLWLVPFSPNNVFLTVYLVWWFGVVIPLSMGVSPWLERRLGNWGRASGIILW